MNVDSIISKLKQDSTNIHKFSKNFRIENNFSNAKLIKGKIKICGVDGGFVSKQISSSALIIRRSIATCFEYTGTHLKNAEYFSCKKS